MMRKFTTSYDDLIRNYYGNPGRTGLKDSVTLEELFANYYGNAAVGADERKKTQRPQVMSLRHDTGEVLPQRRRRTRARYGYQQSADADGFEEYVVTSAVASTQSVAMSVEAPLVETPDVREEYTIDILAPLPESPAAGPRPAIEGAGAVASPSPAAIETPAKDVAREELSRAKVSDHDIIGDLEAIMRGEKVYDPNTKKTVNKNSLTAAQSTPGGLPAPQAGDGHAIFDAIAQSMSYANAYDLGTVELENRFADFDRITELQQKAAQDTKKKSDYARSYSVASAAAVKNADFIEDLDAIRRQQESGSSAVSIAESMSAAIVEEMVQSDRDPVCRPWALSLSAGDDPANYSRPLYDAGEHVMTGWDLYTDQLRVGQSPGVMFSYGHLIAMGDLYKDDEVMMKASVDELRAVKNLLTLSQRYYTGHRADRSLDVSDDNWVNVIGQRYLDLAEDNYEHFAPNNIYKNEPWVANVRKSRDNKREWTRYHTRAITEAQKILQKAGDGSTPPFLELPLIINGFGDHFLTDAFASGHTISKDATIEMFKYNFYNGKSLKSAAEKFFERVAEKAFKGEVRKKFSVLETFDPVILWWNPNIDTVNAFRKLLIAVAEQKPDEVANLAVKALHDNLNKHGVEVTNDAGDGVWRLTGDGLLDTKNLEIIKKAVQQSVDNVNDPANRTTPNIAAAIDKVWKHVPRLTDPGKAQVRIASEAFTTPESDRLVEATADLISRKVDLLIKKLLAAKKLKYA
ncbi:MAG TPA: hypothetical protein VGJ48_20085 [Pyrinomonadaceae bacterium]